MASAFGGAVISPCSARIWPAPIFPEWRCLATKAALSGICGVWRSATSSRTPRPSRRRTALQAVAAVI